MGVGKWDLLGDVKKGSQRGTLRDPKIGVSQKGQKWGFWEGV